MGLSFKKIVVVLMNNFGFTMDGTVEGVKEIDWWAEKEEEMVINTLRGRVKACDGVQDALKMLSAIGNTAKHSNTATNTLSKLLTTQPGLSVVSSSSIYRIQQSLLFAGLFLYFPVTPTNPHPIVSAITSLPTPAPKPSPACYLHAMRQLNLDPSECIAVEDSRTGALSAINAGIRTIGYVGCFSEGRKREALRELLGGLGCVAVMGGWGEFEAVLGSVLEG